MNQLNKTLDWNQIGEKVLEIWGGLANGFVEGVGHRWWEFSGYEVRLSVYTCYVGEEAKQQEFPPGEVVLSRNKAETEVKLAGSVSYQVNFMNSKFRMMIVSPHVSIENLPHEVVVPITSVRVLESLEGLRTGLAREFVLFKRIGIRWGECFDGQRGFVRFVLPWKEGERSFEVECTIISLRFSKDDRARPIFLGSSVILHKRQSGWTGKEFQAEYEFSDMRELPEKYIMRLRGGFYVESIPSTIQLHLLSGEVTECAK